MAAQHDVIVVGSGAGGGSVAYKLVNAGKRVLLIEKGPFLPRDAWADKNGRPDLYLRMFSKRYDNLAVLGFLEFASAAYTNFDHMAELIVADAVAERDAPLARKLSEKKRSHQPDLTGGHRYIATPRHANYVDVDAYLKVLGQVKREIGVAA